MCFPRPFQLSGKTAIFRPPIVPPRAHPLDFSLRTAKRNDSHGGKPSRRNDGRLRYPSVLPAELNNNEHIQGAISHPLYSLSAIHNTPPRDAFYCVRAPIIIDSQSGPFFPSEPFQLICIISDFIFQWGTNYPFSLRPGNLNLSIRSSPCSIFLRRFRQWSTESQMAKQSLQTANFGFISPSEFVLWRRAKVSLRGGKFWLASVTIPFWSWFFN